MIKELDVIVSHKQPGLRNGGDGRVLRVSLWWLRCMVIYSSVCCGSSTAVWPVLMRLQVRLKWTQQGPHASLPFIRPVRLSDSFVLLSPDFLPPESTRRRRFKKLTSHFSMIYVLFLSSKVSDPFERYDCYIINVRQMVKTRHSFLLMNFLKAQSLFQKLYL